MPQAGAAVDLKVKIDELAAMPDAMRDSVAGLTGAQLDTKYRNWTIRQITHHVADSHLNCYTRFMLALTEDTPTIRPYDEGAWASLPVSRTGDVETPLATMRGVHGSWVAVLRSMTEDDFGRAFHHPELRAPVRLRDALAQYAWHGRHHIAQIRWRRAAEGWG